MKCRGTKEVPARWGGSAGMVDDGRKDTWGENSAPSVLPKDICEWAVPVVPCAPPGLMESLGLLLSNRVSADRWPSQSDSLSVKYAGGSCRCDAHHHWHQARQHRASMTNSIYCHLKDRLTFLSENNPHMTICTFIKSFVLSVLVTRRSLNTIMMMIRDKIQSLFSVKKSCFEASPVWVRQTRWGCHCLFTVDILTTPGQFKAMNKPLYLHVKWFSRLKWRFEFWVSWVLKI